MGVYDRAPRVAFAIGTYLETLTDLRGQFFKAMSADEDPATPRQLARLSVRQHVAQIPGAPVACSEADAVETKTLPVLIN